MKRLWCVDFESDNVPQPEFGPEFDNDIQVLVADDTFALVRAEREELEDALKATPYWQFGGAAPNGHYTDMGGDYLYIAAGEIVDQITCAEACGLTPADFGEESWDDVDPLDIDDALPAF